MPSQLVFHGGMHKAGSTFLQKAVFPNLKETIYIGRYPNKPLSKLFVEKNSEILIWSDEALIGRLVDIYAGDRNHTWVEADIFNIEKLKILHPDSKLILCFREPSAWLPSIYKHFLKYGGTLNSYDFFSKVIDINDLKIEPRIKAAKSIYGNDFLGFYFEDLIKGKDVGLETHLGVSKIFVNTAQKYNQGLRFHGRILIRGLNKFPWFGGLNHPDRNDRFSIIFKKMRLTPFGLSNLLDNFLSFIPDHKIRLPDGLLSNLMEDYKDSKKLLGY